MENDKNTLYANTAEQALETVFEYTKSMSNTLDVEISKKWTIYRGKKSKIYWEETAVVL